MNRLILGLAAALLLTAVACAPAPETTEPEAETADAPAPAPEEPKTWADEFADPIEATHGADAWRGHEAVSMQGEVIFGGSPAFSGKILFTTDTGRVRMETEDGALAIWDGKTAWVSPADHEMQGARFHLLTWPYFLAVPFKLQDPGTELVDLGQYTLGETDYDAAKLTFDAGVGDTPEDWYIVYRDPATNVLHAMAYIVTFGKDTEAAEEEPHAIVYTDYREVQGVQVPHMWEFYNWSEEEGVFGDPIGTATLSEVTFLTPAEDAFTVPEDAREEGLPPANAG